MAIKRINKTENANMEEALASQIGAIGGDIQDDDIDLSNIPTEEQAAEMVKKDVEQKSIVGQKLQKYGKLGRTTQEEMTKFDTEKHLSKIGQSIGENAEIRDGWMTVDRNLLGERDVFYPETWEFRIKPATVEAIRNWSTIDEENANSIDIVFDEILKSCLAIRTPDGPLPWNQINTWDRFFFVLLIREYTFINGDSKVEFKRECSNCESEVTFTLNSQSLMYDIPDEEVMNSYDRANRVWHIYPSEYDIEYPGDEITMYLPTREKDTNIKNYIINRAQQDPNAKIDRVFFKFLPWMLPKISKDVNIARGQIRKAESEYKSWDIDMFEFMDSVVTNITVTPATTLIATCEACGEEVTAPIQFPNGIASLFHRNNTVAKRFGKK
jgi:hypothetical protein